MNRLLWIAICLIGSGLAADRGVEIQVAGGTLAELPAKLRGRMDLTGTEALLFRFAKSEVRVDYRKVNTLEYGQNVSRRYAAAIIISPLLLLSKSRWPVPRTTYCRDASKRNASRGSA